MLVKLLKQSVKASACSLVFIASISGFYTGNVSASEAILEKNCMGCHTPESTSPLKLSRISHQRKTPEGWLMTIVRMQTTHGLKIDGETRSELVEYLANTQGLTPSEASPYRYILERRLNHIEDKQPELAEMCARCHSEARVGLQKREQIEWEHLVNFHLGQWPSTEFSAMGRDRNWFEVAKNQVVPFLGNKYNLDMQNWIKWQKKEKAQLDGKWRIVGSMPGTGAFQGDISLTHSKNNDYQMTFTGQFDNGEKLTGVGSVLVYSGFEWRGSLSVGDKRYRQVFALNEAGDSLTGRMFLNGQEDIGLDINGNRSEKARILSLSPRFIKAGTTQQISIRGSALSGAIKLTNGLNVIKEVSRTADEIIVQVSALATNDSAIATSVAVGNLSIGDALVTYQKIDEIKVLPSYAVARVGEGGGDQPKVTASFEAQAYASGEDGQLGTDDDVFIGIFPAKWHVEAFDEQALADEDVKFAGVMNEATGVFMPGDAGPNPERKYGTNNAGHLSVVAEVADGDKSLKGKGELIVTVQRWNNPPIR